MLLPANLEKLRVEIREKAIEYGLDFFEVIFEMLDYDQMNQVAAYAGFPTRYPHWSFGMEYERMRKSYNYGLHRIYEMVINNDPCYAYLLDSNQQVDQKIVMAHVYAHSDFFKNNLWFAHTNRKMMDEMANHGARIRRYMDKYGEDTVEDFIDACLSLENLIDPHLPGIRRRPAPPPPVKDKEEDQEEDIRPAKLKAKEYMDAFINPPEVLAEEAERRKAEAQALKKRFPPQPEKDVLLFLLENAPLESWQADVLAIIREEAYYFAPQRQTKIMNEGWACVRGDTLLYTDQGMLRIDEIVNRRLAVRVSDGKTMRRVYDWARFENRETVWVRTKRGLELEGSVTHRLMLPDGSWRRLDEIQVGDSVQLGAGCNQWPQEIIPLDWQPRRRLTLQDIAVQVGVDIETVIRYRSGVRGRYSDQLAPVVAEYEAGLATLPMMQNARHNIRVPRELDEKLATFLGYLVGDGHISELKRVIGLTTGDEELADHFRELVEALFGITPRKKWDAGRWRLGFHSRHVEDFLKHLGLRTGRAANVKEIPHVVLRSPKAVVAAFLRAYFDCDGYAGKQGVILSTSSEAISKTVQLLLLNFGILSGRRPHKDGCWHVHIMGKSAAVFEMEIGFGLRRKQQALQKYVEEHRWFKQEEWVDQIVAIERRTADVYDISVEETHRYAAQGFINHNSYWHSTIMTQSGVLTSAEVIDYADHHSGVVATSPGRLNPYKLGVELYKDIEDRWNKGRFGKDYEECDDLVVKARWDKQLGLGREKIFEVRRVYNDIGFIDTFLTEEFCQEHKLFSYRYNERRGEYEIESRDFERIKARLLFGLTNFGYPFIYVEDANYANRGELYLKHRHEGIDMQVDQAKDTLQNVHKLWGRPVHVETIIEGTPRLMTFDGQEHRIRKL